ncbi:MAG: ABC transporter substrate-binding protein [Desulfatibacillum sp.]|nr:ABC transporter substrate-binding protein [Desulfatibacillum sp.]
MKEITRRSFMKTTGTVALGAALGSLAPRKAWSSGVPTIKMAYILSDHHAPLMVAATQGELFDQEYKTWLKPLNPAKLYELYDHGSSIARVQLIPTKKGSDVEKLVANGSVDMAISGTQSIMASIDKGVDTKIISPLQTAGNVFVLKKEIPVETWDSFVAYVKGQGKQFKIGMPGPQTVSAIIFRSALDYEGVTYTEDSRDNKADILFINMKGHGNLVAALSNNITEGIIGAQPFPSVTIDQGIGRQILNLQDVPPAQRWAGHACCSLEATGTFMTQEPELVGRVLSLMALGVEVANTRKDLTAQACSSWLGVSESVEIMAMQTMTYTTVATERWIESVNIYAQTMDGMGMFDGKLKGVQGSALEAAAFDFAMMNNATRQLKAKGLIA